MSARQSAEVTQALELIRTGSTLRDAAKALGVADSTLVRACKRNGITLPRGRRPTGAAGVSKPAAAGRDAATHRREDSGGEISGAASTESRRSGYEQ